MCSVMNNIIEPNANFDFSQLTLSHPSGIQGGAYFTKIECNKKPLYIQTPKGLIRQGFVKNGKKFHCDLLFDKNAETFINWIENLEEKCQKLIFEKSENWFQGSLVESEVENAFTPLIRVYKSGKFYLLRTNGRTTQSDEPAVKIYNESEVPLSVKDIKPETNIISILEIQGIKFTTRNFQIEIELKQIMALDNDPIFDNCLIKGANKQIQKPPVPIEQIQVQEPKQELKTKELIQEPKQELIQEPLEITKPEFSEKEAFTQNLDTNNSIINVDIEELDENSSDNLKEVNFTSIFNNADDTESLKLKQPNQIYFELYKEARKKAKEAKKNAIIAYLEAKNIKKSYMIDNINDSDSDFDAEIDDVSESDLDNFDE